MHKPVIEQWNIDYRQCRKDYPYWFIIVWLYRDLLVEALAQDSGLEGCQDPVSTLILWQESSPEEVSYTRKFRII